ncbi:hypothetical protein Q765_14935 [Flavobacterium rivuli WB 3.3-2 = DSM 21788]|uniref:Uncharacterized protein n=1 Tax=Flavobacterium rivuli WB 3.3-2 = DSM 21788 TaxID=1121895 RepID=A0A0A2M0E5_9FLAO|nr:hypothetical protein [Flavobacterium rivuli]KGO85714.1 hypothetical protein Q765_14935 [Flavobacterium rivuli WB 3.3-2 = DSM 21788]
MDFTTMDIATLTHSVTGKGVPYLEVFLKEYTSLFGGPVNPACPKCLTAYLTNYQNHFNAMQNTCDYKLHKKFENIPLQFGSPILVNNSNITNEYAEILLQQPNGLRFFAEIPSAGDPFDGSFMLADESPVPEEEKDESTSDLVGEVPLEGSDDIDIYYTDQP